MNITETYIEFSKGIDLKVANLNPSLIRRRDRLVSAMLEDRQTLRLISAPSGFGKTCLAYEYAKRLFPANSILWINANTPEFVRNIDEGRLMPYSLEFQEYNLVVLDNLPHIDEQRSEILIKCIENLLFYKTEVIVTTLPSNDTLRSKILGLTLINAEDLLITERDALGAQLTHIEDAGPTVEISTQQAASIVKQKSSILFGLTPQGFWSSTSTTCKDLLKSFFTEGLPLEVLKTAFAMLLIGNGDLEQLEKYNLKPKFEIESMLAKNYPFISLDLVHNSFKIASFDFRDLNKAIEEAGLTSTFINGSYTIPEKCLDILARQNALDRTLSILEEFCSQQRCLNWIEIHGWDLLDNGEARLIDTLFQGASSQNAQISIRMLSLLAWTCGLLGNPTESAYYAYETMRHKDNDQDNYAICMAYLALLAFESDTSISLPQIQKEDNTITTPEEFLVAVVNACEKHELLHAFALQQEKRQLLSTKKYKSPSQKRKAVLENLFTNVSDHFSDTPQYRFALHLLQSINDTELHNLLRRLGGRVMICARRNNLSTFTEAVLTQDMWSNGFFGVANRTHDIRDARLYDEASELLSKLGESVSGQPIIAAWENSIMKKTMTKTKKNQGSDKIENLHANKKGPVLYVRMFGALEVYLNDTLIQDSCWRKKARHMFSLLVLNLGKDVTRDFLFEQIWPHMDRARAMDNFYSIWSNITNTLHKGPFIDRRGEFCRVNPLYVSSDISEFESLVRSLLTEHINTAKLLDIYTRIDTVYRGDLLPAETSVPYINASRERFKNLFVDAMITASNQALKTDKEHMALWFAKKAVTEDSKREDAFLSLMKAQISAGQRCSAIQTYLDCQKSLRENLGLDASVEMKSLYSQLITQDPTLIKLSENYA